MHGAVAQGLRRTIYAQARTLHSLSSKSGESRPVQTLYSNFNHVDLDEFREKAFAPQLPVIIAASETVPYSDAFASAIPAARKWFSLDVQPGDTKRTSQRLELSKDYFAPYAETVLPYELYHDQDARSQKDLGHEDIGGELGSILSSIVDPSSPPKTFYRFNAPLSLFLQASRLIPGKGPSLRLYIAQAQIADLPNELRDDLPTPRLVREAGKGDVYDANIWIGMPPTYTPLHKDPNPNLFIQLASRKRVRLFPPAIGTAIFFQVQRDIGGHASAQIRGEEMMETAEREVLDEYVWGNKVSSDGFEVVINPGDALFIPKGWWHSIKSMGSDINASVNWWFR